MSVRAYKIAEELGIERNDFVEKARSLGIELKSAMASLDDAQVAELKEKLGATKEQVTEARVETRAGSRAVIRRRRRAEPEPEAAPVAEAEAAPEAVAPAAGEPEVAPAAAPEEVTTPEAPAVSPAGTPEPVAPAAAAPGQPATPGTGPRPAEERPAARAPRPGTPDSRPGDKRGSQRKQFREVVNLREQEQIARQVTSRTVGRPAPVSVDTRAFTNPRRKRRDAPAARAPVAAVPPKEEKRVVRIDGTISVAELAKQLGVKAAEVQGKLMGLGTMVSLNQAVSTEIAEQLATGYGYEIQDVGFKEADLIEGSADPVDESRLVSRPPVVTVMGHVDHGKTSLLDALRKTKVVEGEAGGITQHIGAYQVQLDDARITFIDTPGHAAFTAMRARGAEVTDIVVLVVAASEGIMPQTIEGIDHAKAAGVPIVVAVNKCDLPDANPQLVRQRLMEHELVTEEFGGDVLAIDVSAAKGTGLEGLLEAIHLQSELLELKADPTKPARGVVVEAELDKGRGPVATVLVQEGVLKRGESIVAGTCFGRVRTMLDEDGQVLKEAGPSTPVQIIGLTAVPPAGAELQVVKNERAAKQIVSHREDVERGAPTAPRPRMTLEDLFNADGDGPKELNLVVKGDTDGSVGALRDSLLKLPTEKVKLNVLHASVGAIRETDVQLAHTSGAIVVGFHVRPDTAARKSAETLGVDLRLYQIIYEVIDEIRTAMAGLLAPTVSEKPLGNAEVRDTFTIPKVGTIAGCYVTDGLVRRNAHCRLVRDGVQIYEGKFASLRRFKDDTREVQSGFECGIGLESYNDVKIGDVIEAFELEETPAEL